MAPAIISQIIYLSLTSSIIAMTGEGFSLALDGAV